MPRNGSGTYSLTGGNPVVTGSAISSTDFNNTMTDVATALTGSIAADGQTAWTGNQNANGSKVTGLANGSAAQDSATFAQLFGSGQSYVDVSASRAQSTTYTNSTTRAIYVAVAVTPSVTGNILGRVGGLAVDTKYCTAGQLNTLAMVVPVNGTYDVIPSGATFTIFSWVELR